MGNTFERTCGRFGIQHISRFVSLCRHTPRMRYVRFLKIPKLQGDSITATITITSDLGETFLNEEVQVVAMLRAADPRGDIYLRTALKWKPSMRTLSVSFSLAEREIGWPARVYVAPKDAPDPDCFDKQHGVSGLPNIISAWSDILDPSEGITIATRTVERRFKPLSSHVLSMWEETGESIARHLWFAASSVDL